MLFLENIFNHLFIKIVNIEFQTPDPYTLEKNKKQGLTLN